MSFETAQEQFWAGRFGDDYIERNQGDALLASNIALFSRALDRATSISSCLELGANIGMNLRALRLLLPSAALDAVEINASAAQRLAEVIPAASVHHGSILEFSPRSTWDLVLTKGVLIHIAPERLATVYDTLARCARRYILLVEYYNPTPVSMSYRGHEDRLYKRDFAGEMMDRHPQFPLVDYGFQYRRDPIFPQDDLTWFLMQAKQ